MKSRCFRKKCFICLFTLVILLIVNGCEKQRSAASRRTVEEDHSYVAEKEIEPKIEKKKRTDKTPEEYRDTICTDRDFIVVIDENGKVVIDGSGTEVYEDGKGTGVGFVPKTYDWGTTQRVFLIGNGLLGVDDSGNLHLSDWPDEEISITAEKEYIDFSVAFGQIIGLTPEGGVEIIHEDGFYYNMYGITRDDITSYFSDKSIKRIGGEIGGIGWVSFSTGWCYLTADGKVEMLSNTYATADNYKDEDEHFFKEIKDEISTWDDIVDISVSVDHILGLKSDGTVVAAGSNDSGQCSVDDWSNMIMVSAGEGHSVGLNSEGKVLASGSNGYGQTDVSEWENIICVCAGGFGTLAIDEDGHYYYQGDIMFKNVAKINNADSGIASASEDTYAITKKSSAQNISSDYKKCEVDDCYNTAMHVITGIGGKTEYYCDKHYKEMKSIAQKMESDVETNTIVRHTCEVCSKEGTHSVIGISGATEYYCTEHYNELIEIMKSFSN